MTSRSRLSLLSTPTRGGASLPLRTICRPHRYEGQHIDDRVSSVTLVAVGACSNGIDVTTAAFTSVSIASLTSTPSERFGSVKKPNKRMYE